MFRSKINETGNLERGDVRTVFDLSAESRQYADGLRESNSDKRAGCVKIQISFHVAHLAFEH